MPFIRKTEDEDEFEDDYDWPNPIIVIVLELELVLGSFLFMVGRTPGETWTTG